MRVCRLLNKEGKKELIRAYHVNEFSVYWLNNWDYYERPNRKQPPKRYCKNIITFDIETTTLPESKTGFMYIWTMVIDGYLIYGDTWRQWLDFMDRLADWLECDFETRLVCWIQNLSFETQFMKDFLHAAFGDCEVFATDKRKPIKFIVPDKGLEFRCTYRLSNMNLAAMAKNELAVKHLKLVGDLDYSKCRVPGTPLTIQEFSYCGSDTYVLYEWVKARLDEYKDDFFSIPVTSTGYVRRDLRAATKKDRRYRDYFKRNLMSEEVYYMLKEAGRGGNTHANRHYVDRIMKDVDSFDETSAYIYALFKKYPITKFTKYGKPVDVAEFKRLKNKYCMLFRIILNNPRVKKDVPVPYIPVAKLTNRSRCGKVVNDNGRVLAMQDGGQIYLTVTELDFDIILKEYDFDNVAIYDVYTARKGYLPRCIRDELLKYFKEKCELKIKIKKKEAALDVAISSERKKQLRAELAELQYYYQKSKNRLNSIFGLMYTDPVRDLYEIDEEANWKDVQKANVAEALEKYNTSYNSYLVYAHGVYCTAYARDLLEKVIEATGTGKNLCLYCDTDSSKCKLEDFEPIEKLNEAIKKDAEKIGAYVDVEGERFYLGVLEHETKRGKYTGFITQGAKKYAYTDKDGLHVTVSGVVKAKAPKELKSLDNFRKGFVFRDAGGNTLVYNDEGIHTIEVDGVEIETASNAAILPDTYTIGRTHEYERIIELYAEKF